MLKVEVGVALLKPVGSLCFKLKREHDTLQHYFRNSASSIALAASFPLPTLGDAMDEVRLSIDRFGFLAGIKALHDFMRKRQANSALETIRKAA